MTTKTGELGEGGKVAALCLLGVLLAALFAFLIPADATDLPQHLRGLNPDENDHIDYIRKLWEEKGLVTFQPRTAGYVETYQSPLYYLLCVPVFALSGGSLLAVRLVAALIQAGTIWLTWRAGRDLFPGRTEIALGAAAFVACLPTQAQLAGAVNNDGLTTLICAAIFWRLGLLLRQGQSAREAAGLGALLGIGLLTKLTVLQLLPAVLVAYALAARGTLTGWGAAAKRAATALGVGFALASPWLIRNARLYGDPFTIKIFPLTAPENTPTPAFIMERMGWSFGEYVLHNAHRTLATFHFLLPPFKLTPHPAAFGFVALVGFVALAGVGRGMVRGRLAEPEARRILAAAFATIVLLVPFFVRFNLQFFQAQGRYFLPALLPAALIVAAGWAEWGGKNARVALGALAVVLFLMSVAQAVTYCQTL